VNDDTQEPTKLVTGCYHRVRGKAVAFREGPPPKKRRPVRMTGEGGLAAGARAPAAGGDR
jgi:hypothetical protein